MTSTIESESMFRARLATFVLLAWPTAVLAQEGAIGGTVTDENGLALPTVSVTATGAARGGA